MIEILTKMMPDLFRYLLEELAKQKAIEKANAEAKAAKAKMTAEAK